MTNEQAINELKDWQTAFSRMTHIDKDMSYAIEALSMAIEALSAQPEQGCDECVFKPFKQFQPERKGEWIPVSETSDIPEKEVLACDKYGEEMFGYLFVKDEQLMCESDTEIMYEVVAWMNKPEPYRGES